MGISDCIERLDNYQQVRVGDYLSTREGDLNGKILMPKLARVFEVTDRDCFYY